MPRSRPIGMLTLAMIGLAGWACVAADDLTNKDPFSIKDPAAKREEAAVKRAVQSLFLSKVESDHVKGIGRAKELPATEAIKILVQLGLGDRSREVRHAAYEALLTYKNDADAMFHLQKVLDKESRSKSDAKAENTAAPLIAVLLASPNTDVRASLDKFLDQYIASPKHGAQTVLAVADELGAQNTKQALDSLWNLTRLKCCAKNFACRRAAAQGIIHNTQPEVVAVLIDVLARFDGEVRGDVSRHLGTLTSQPHGDNVAAWQDWWRTNRNSFKLPENPDGKAGAGQGNQQGQSSFYGFSLRAKRLVFVIDTSGSMDGPRIAAAKRELLHAIDHLPEDTEFGLVSFSTAVTVWARGLQRASPSVKQTASQFVQRLRAGGRTATFDALDAAFLFDAEAIYLLTDGAPTCGKFVFAKDILAAVQQANYSRRMSIYTIGIDPPPEEPVFDFEGFLKSLASQNYGIYRRVDQ